MIRLLEVNRHTLSELLGKDMRPLYEKYMKQSGDPGFKDLHSIHEFVLSSVLRDDSMFIVGLDESDQPVGYILCKIDYRPLLGIKECVVWQVVSLLNDRKLAAAVMKAIEEWAAGKGCDIMRANSYRTGMEEHLKKFGYRYKLSIFEKEIKKGGR